MNNPPVTKRQYLRDLVEQKNKWAVPLSEADRALGLLGWHERGYLPHCDFPDLIQFVTFRLADSMPASRRGEWEHLLAIEDAREKRSKLEDYLDRGVGECHLRDPCIARRCEEALLFFHKKRYELLAWCVMPNHVHVLVHVWQTALARMVQSWKRYASTQAQAILTERRSPTRPFGHGKDAPDRRAALRTLRWQREYWDTFMRDEEQERKAIRYIEANPVKARLCGRAVDWPFSSSRFRDAYQRLSLPERTN